MLTATLDLLESFKKHQISKLIEQVRNRIFLALQSPKFNQDLAHYFSPINPEGPPFTNYDLDPDNISQIKKLINALYYARLSFLDLENINVTTEQLRKSYTDLKFLHDETIDKTYQASYLLTHLDVDIREMFQEELALLTPLLNTLSTLVTNKSDQTQQLTEPLKTHPLSYKIGEITGIALEQMQPSTGELDYSFLTDFSGTLPSYIDKVTHFLSQHSAKIIKMEQEPTLNHEKMAEIQNAAFKLLNDLENIKGKNLFVSFKFLKYINIINNIFTLSMSVLEQIGNVLDASQDVIRDKLAQLKYRELPDLFRLVDKIEVNCMLKPGTLSAPLMEKIKPLYQTLIFYASKHVNFQEKGEELLSIEDSRFLAQRLEATYKRIDDANNSLFSIEKSQKALKGFYNILSDLANQEVTLHQLPSEIKEQLILHYKMLKPYMMSLDVDLNDTIINSLQQNEESWSSYLGTPWRWLTSGLPADHLSNILAKKEILERFITKKKNTQEFHIKLNTDLIAHVHKETNLVLFPYSEETNVFTLEESPHPESLLISGSIFTIDENKIINPEDTPLPQLKLEKKDGNRFVANPQHLTAEQAVDLYQYYKNKHQHLILAQNAYNEMMALLAQHIQAHAPVPDHKLYLQHMDTTLKIRCHDLYSRFQPYFLESAPSSMKAKTIAFDAFILQALSQKENIPNPEENVLDTLEKHFRNVFKETDDLWKKKTKIYYQWAQKKRFREDAHVFLIDESKALRLTKEDKLTLKFTKEHDNKTVTDPQQLTSKQALSLSQWYRHKRAKFQKAQKAYNEFMTLLSQDNPNSNEKLELAQLEKEKKTRYRKLYNLFQPYFINGIPAEMHDVAVEFDKYLVHSFAENAPFISASSINMIKTLDEHFQVFFTKIDLDWKAKSKSLKKIAEQKLSQENEAAPLTIDINSEKRAHHLIKHTDYSKFVHKIRASLYELTARFNNTMQAELKSCASGVPFPELEDKHLRLTQSKQIIAIKQIFNTLYHVEGIVKQLEKLNDKSYKTTYVYYLIEAYNHTNEILKLTKSLSEDPHIGLISRELFDKAQMMWATIQEHTDAYKAGFDQIKDGKTVQFSGLWYSLNAFFISPKHIRSLTHHTDLTNQELHALHSRAKASAVTIEKVINSSHSYFKLFLQVPSMYKLYRELTTQLNEFITTSHDTMMNNLEHFNAKLFTPMLLEADLWEDKLGLIPGTFSVPLKKIIDQYYKGLLHPLNLPSKTHIQLISNDHPLEQRLIRTYTNIDHAEQNIQKTEKTYQPIIVLYQLLEHYEEITGSLIQGPDLDRSEAKHHLITAYKKALPRLVSLKKELQFQPDARLSHEELEVDSLLNSSVKEYDAQLTQISALIKSSYHYYLGLKNTYHMELNIANEKLTFLKELAVSHKQANVDFIHEYTTESFNRQLEALCNRHIGLQYTDKEYSAKLKDYLQDFQTEIIKRAKGAEDINLKITHLLKARAKSFKTHNFAKYYHLDAVRVTLEQFKIYFSDSTTALDNDNSLFESKLTLEPKTNKIKALINIATEENVTINERIAQITTQVNNPNFARIILAHQQVDILSFTYLKLCLLSLLEVLHIYTPKHKQHYNELKNAVTNRPTISESTQRFGLFSRADSSVSPKPASPTNDESPNLTTP
jgi:hypothetical protein